MMEPLLTALGAEHTVPSEIQRLLNPAYCVTVLARCAAAYVKGNTSAAGRLPYVLAYLCLPMVLHGPTREEINRHQTKYGLHRFVRENPASVIDLAERARGYRRTTQEAILFGTHHHVLFFDIAAGALVADSKFVSHLTRKHLGADAMPPIQAAERLGSWFAGLTPAEVFLHLNLRP